MKLAITQMVLGFVIALEVLVALWRPIYAFYIIGALGLAILGLGIVQYLKSRNLATAQIVLGAVIVLDVLFWGYAGTYLGISPQRWAPVTIPLFPVSGLAVLGCGIVQFSRARGLKGAEPL